MTRSLIILGVCLTGFFGCVVLAVVLNAKPATEPIEQALQAPLLEEIIASTTPVATTSPVVAIGGCVVGVPGPAADPLEDIITPAMKEAAVRAVLAREALFLANDPVCLRAYSLAVAVSPEQREEIAKQEDKTIRATALMMALIMDLPDAAEVRRLMLKEDAVWEYKEGEVHVNVIIENPPEEVVGHHDDGTPLYGTSNGWGTTIYYRDGRWY